MGNSSGPNNALRGRVLIGQRITKGVEPPAQLVEGNLYQGKLHAVSSEPGEGKTIYASWVSLEVMKQGLPVLYLDAENGPDRIAELLADMGADPEMLDRLFQYYYLPEITMDPDALKALLATVEEL
jgi:KaiC/GvpD/RAD55 family RecA-like ATPase